MDNLSPQEELEEFANQLLEEEQQGDRCPAISSPSSKSSFQDDGSDQSLFNFLPTALSPPSNPTTLDDIRIGVQLARIVELWQPNFSDRVAEFQGVGHIGKNFLDSLYTVDSSHGAEAVEHGLREHIASYFDEEAHSRSSAEQFAGSPIIPWEKMDLEVAKTVFSLAHDGFTSEDTRKLFGKHLQNAINGVQGAQVVGVDQIRQYLFGVEQRMSQQWKETEHIQESFKSLISELLADNTAGEETVAERDSGEVTVETLLNSALEYQTRFWQIPQITWGHQPVGDIEIKAQRHVKTLHKHLCASLGERSTTEIARRKLHELTQTLEGLAAKEIYAARLLAMESHGSARVMSGLTSHISERRALSLQDAYFAQTPQTTSFTST